MLLGWSHAAFAQRPPAIVPDDPQTLVETLPRGYAALMPTAAPLTPAQILPQVQQLLGTSARTGDFRLAARADALLSRFPSTDRNRNVLAARAYTAQHRHDFAAALSLLDELIALDPRDGEARLSRAQIQLVQGRLRMARNDCTALLGIDIADGLLCTASLSLRKGDTAAAASLLERWLAQSAPGGESQRYALTLRAEVAGRAGVPGADAWYKRALALAPDDVRTLAAYARYLRGAGRNAEVEALLAAHADNDGLQLQRTLAASAAGSPLAVPLAQSQARRYRLAHSVGTQPEMRDEAELMLLRHQSEPALALALANFKTQRDYEDVDLLVRAADAAGRPEALDPMRQWAAAEQLAMPPTSGRR